MWTLCEVFLPFLKAQPSRQNALYETFMLRFVVIAENNRTMACAKKVDTSVGTVFQNDPSFIFESVVALLAVIGRFDSVQKT